MTTKVKDSNGTASVTDLKQAVAMDRQQRANECLKRINEALAETNCRLVPILTAVNNDFSQRVEVVAND